MASTLSNVYVRKTYIRNVLEVVRDPSISNQMKMGHYLKAVNSALDGAGVPRVTMQLKPIAAGATAMAETWSINMNTKAFDTLSWCNDFS